MTKRSKAKLFVLVFGPKRVLLLIVVLCCRSIVIYAESNRSRKSCKIEFYNDRRTIPFFKVYVKNRHISDHNLFSL